MATEYLAGATGQYIYGDVVLDCPTCGHDRGLTFTNTSRSTAVTGSCPRGHIWDKHRLPFEAVREAAIATGPRRNWP